VPTACPQWRIRRKCIESSSSFVALIIIVSFDQIGCGTDVRGIGLDPPVVALSLSIRYKIIADDEDGPVLLRILLGSV